MIFSPTPAFRNGINQTVLHNDTVGSWLRRELPTFVMESIYTVSSGEADYNAVAQDGSYTFLPNSPNYIRKPWASSTRMVQLLEAKKRSVRVYRWLGGDSFSLMGVLKFKDME